MVNSRLVESARNSDGEAKKAVICHSHFCIQHPSSLRTAPGFDERTLIAHCNISQGRPRWPLRRQAQHFGVLDQHLVDETQTRLQTFTFACDKCTVTGLPSSLTTWWISLKIRSPDDKRTRNSLSPRTPHLHTTKRAAKDTTHTLTRHAIFHSRHALTPKHSLAHSLTLSPSHSYSLMHSLRIDNFACGVIRAFDCWAPRAASLHHTD